MSIPGLAPTARKMQPSSQSMRTLAPIHVAAMMIATMILPAADNIARFQTKSRQKICLSMQREIMKGNETATAELAHYY